MTPSLSFFFFFFFLIKPPGGLPLWEDKQLKNCVDLCAPLLNDTHSTFRSLGSCTKFKLVTIKLNPLISKMN